MALLRVGVEARDYAEAISAAGSILVSAGKIKPEYIGAMVRVVEELGPYIVLVDGVALAHAEPGEMVLENSISLAVLNSEVDFGSGKLVRAVFALAAIDHDSHIDRLGRLAELLADERVLNILLNEGDTAQIEAVFQGVLGE